MNTRILILVFSFIIFSNQEIYGQGFANELGLTVGPVVFYSDYGERNDFETNSGNVGFGIGLVHYINFARSADCDCYTRDTFWNDHMKVRNEISYHKTNLKHRGKWVGPEYTSTTADQLRGMEGSTSVFEIGSQLEYYPFSVRDFEGEDYLLAPFISAGLHWANFDPRVSTSYGDNSESPTTTPGGNISDPENVPQKYINAFQQKSASTGAIVTSIGVRYKLSRFSDLMLDARWQYYFSDWVDGLNPSFDSNNIVEVPENEANDWVFWLNLGYIYYLD